MLCFKLTKKELREGKTFIIGDAKIIFKMGVGSKSNYKSNGYAVMIEAPREIPIERVNEQRA